jgi:hypothetical protein
MERKKCLELMYFYYYTSTKISTKSLEVHAQKVTEDDGQVNLLNKIEYYSNKSFLS